jgi:hypothetical protein
MSTRVKKALAWSALIILAIFGGISIIVLLSEENPNHPMSLAQFVMLKGLAIASTYGCFEAARHINDSGYLDPKPEDKQ